jgi:hypothetical protein
VEIEFTEEEAEAINRKLSLFSAVAEAQSPEGTETIVHRKLLDAIYAQGLTEYAKKSILEIDDSESDRALASTIDRAMKATMKAYIIHHLPIYLFQTAGMLEMLGDGATAKDLFGRFIREQRTFEPDEVDSIPPGLIPRRSRRRLLVTRQDTPLLAAGLFIVSESGWTRCPQND